ncbi:class I SAM-dependent methyltransferase [Calothrix sp. NIES-3974]|uniref:class I SAM-dependent methyltransferase n=1 Tax=Calothrix sp. NIES-3974 TaxID=2005462 RepID=UPI000B610135|nr:class I SAM-dependent methyltransferase [Calothrix sp. NIES-3974]BAZ05133.1 hypothetical protein NIES3974_17790 [Calothrix sp. NIES-3974]
MAKNWDEAQQKEKVFWENIYVHKSKDINTYTPITTEASISFAQKTLARHKLCFQDICSKVVADIGCGPYGIILGIDNYFINNYDVKPKLIGVDPLMDFYTSDIGLLKQKDNIQLYNSQGEAIPIIDSSCDYVFCVNVIDHVENPAKCISELHRITKNGGVAGISLHIVTPLFSPFSSVLKYLDTNHPHHFTLSKISKLVSSYFDRIEVTYMAAMLEDQPEFAFNYIFKSSDKIRAIKRWSSTLILRTVYFNCHKN